MNSQTQSGIPVDEADDWEPPESATEAHLPENQEADEAFVVLMGGDIKEPRIKPNRFLGESTEQETDRTAEDADLRSFEAWGRRQLRNHP